MTASRYSESPPPPPGWPATKVWPPTQSLDDAFDKLRWAEQHFETLRREVEPFEERDTHTIRCEVDADEGEYTFYVHDLEDVPSDDWGLIAGDCLHNARTALDYLMVRLFGLVTYDKPRYVPRIQFPIYDDPGRFKGAVAELREHSGLSGYLARIEELQPFNVANASVWGWASPTPGFVRMLFPQPVVHALPKALWRLTGLDNLDKHRVINAAWRGVKAPEPFAEPSFVPPDFELVGGGSTYLGPLEEGAKVASLRFATPLPREWKPDEMEMKREFPLVVSIYDEDTFTGRVLEILPFCLWGVRSVLKLFEPVFTRSEPPLPVTAIENVDPVPFL